MNPDAPKGGEVTLAAIGTFDSFNPFILRGTATYGLISPWVILPGGSGSGSTVGHVWESLLTSSADEARPAMAISPRSIELPADKMWVAFELRPEAKFSDGTPVTAEDVAWTYSTLLEKGRPSFRIQMADVKDVVVEGPRRVVFHFKSNANRELPLILGGMPVLPKHFFDGRDFTRPLTDPPLGSGPYRIADFELGRSVTYVRASRLVGGEPADRQGHQQFRPRADRVFPRFDRGDGGVQGRPDRFPQREHLEELGHRLRLSRRPERAGDQAATSRTTCRPACRATR